MKKILILCLLLLPCVLYAQRFKGGVMLGLNASQIDGDILSGYNKAGITGGVFVRSELNHKWEAQFEIKYSPKGSATSKESVEIRKVRLLYIEMPVLLSYQIINDLKIQGGVGFAYMFSAMQTEGSGYYDFQSPPDSFEMNGQIGLWYNFLENFGLSLRYSYSIFPIREGLVSSTVGVGTWYNNVFSLAVAYNIGN